MSAEQVLTGIVYALLIFWLVLAIRNDISRQKTNRIERKNAEMYERLARAWAKKNGLDKDGDAK